MGRLLLDALAGALLVEGVILPKLALQLHGLLVLVRGAQVRRRLLETLLLWWCLSYVFWSLLLGVPLAGPSRGHPTARRLA